MEKDKIKISMRVLKNELSEEKKMLYADTVFEKIEKLPEFKESKKILFYWSNHIDLPTYRFAIKWAQEKDVLLPVVNKNKMHLKKLIDIEHVGGKKNTLYEPITESYHGSVDLAIIPGIAFDNNKYRMGQGRGYYNHLLKHKHAKKIGVGFDFQLIENIPGYWKDVRLDMIITPSKIVI
ncbi:MAG: 5-formyltetrahydrofolate cyclo-ligase [Paludibacteraceae bacterium]